MTSNKRTAPSSSASNKKKKKESTPPYAPPSSSKNTNASLLSSPSPSLENITLDSKGKTAAAKQKLIENLKQAHLLLSGVRQSERPSAVPGLSAFSLGVSQPSLLRHKDREVRVLTAQCVTEVLRIYSPNEPYDDETLLSLFELFVSLFKELADPSSEGEAPSSSPLLSPTSSPSPTTSPSLSARCLSILESLAKFRFCVRMLDLECDSLILEMFNTFFQVASPSHPLSVHGAMTDIVCQIIIDSEGISHPILECVLEKLTNDAKLSSPFAHKIALVVLIRTASILQPAVVRYLSLCSPASSPLPSPPLSPKAKAKGTEKGKGKLAAAAALSPPSSTSPPLSLRASYYDLLLSLFLNCSSIAKGMENVLVEELKHPDVSVRLKVVALLDRVFSSFSLSSLSPSYSPPLLFLLQEFRKLVLELMQREKDRSAQVRAQVLSLLAKILLGAAREEGAWQDAKQAKEIILAHVTDAEEIVRLASVHSLSSLSLDKRTLLSEEEMMSLTERLRDKKVPVRRSCFSSLLALFRSHCARCEKGEEKIGDRRFRMLPGKLLLCINDSECKDFKSPFILMNLSGHFSPSPAPPSSLATDIQPPNSSSALSLPPPSPPPLSFSPGLFPVSLSPSHQSLHWVEAFRTMGGRERAALNTVLRLKRRVRVQLSQLISLRKELKALSFNEEDVTGDFFREKTKTIYSLSLSLSSSFPDPSRAEACLSLLLSDVVRVKKREGKNKGEEKEKREEEGDGERDEETKEEGDVNDGEKERKGEGEEKREEESLDWLWVGVERLLGEQGLECEEAKEIESNLFRRAGSSRLFSPRSSSTTPPSPLSSDFLSLLLSLSSPRLLSHEHVSEWMRELVKEVDGTREAEKEGDKRREKEEEVEVVDRAKSLIDLISAVVLPFPSLLVPSFPLLRDLLHLSFSPSPLRPPSPPLLRPLSEFSLLLLSLVLTSEIKRQFEGIKRGEDSSDKEEDGGEIESLEATLGRIALEGSRKQAKLSVLCLFRLLLPSPSLSPSPLLSLPSTEEGEKGGSDNERERREKHLRELLHTCVSSLFLVRKGHVCPLSPLRLSAILQSLSQIASFSPSLPSPSSLLFLNREREIAPIILNNVLELREREREKGRGRELVCGELQELGEEPNGLKEEGGREGDGDDERGRGGTRGWEDEVRVWDIKKLGLKVLLHSFLPYHPFLNLEKSTFPYDTYDKNTLDAFCAFHFGPDKALDAHKCSNFMDLLEGVIATGETSRGEGWSSEEISRVRLSAAFCALSLIARRGSEINKMEERTREKSLSLFHCVMDVAMHPSLSVSRSLCRKIHILLTRNFFPLSERYAAAYCLSAASNRQVPRSAASGRGSLHGSNSKLLSKEREAFLEELKIFANDFCDLRRRKVLSLVAEELKSMKNPASTNQEMEGKAEEARKRIRREGGGGMEGEGEGEERERREKGREDKEEERGEHGETSLLPSSSSPRSLSSSPLLSSPEYCVLSLLHALAHSAVSFPSPSLSSSPSTAIRLPGKKGGIGGGEKRGREKRGGGKGKGNEQEDERGGEEEGGEGEERWSREGFEFTKDALSFFLQTVIFSLHLRAPTYASSLPLLITPSPPLSPSSRGRMGRKRGMGEMGGGSEEKGEDAEKEETEETREREMREEWREALQNNVPLLLALMRRVKRVEDARDRRKTRNLHVACDVGIILTKTFGRMKNFSDLSTHDYVLRFPSDLFDCRAKWRDASPDGSCLPPSLLPDIESIKPFPHHHATASLQGGGTVASGGGGGGAMEKATTSLSLLRVPASARKGSQRAVKGKQTESAKRRGSKRVVDSEEEGEGEGEEEEEDEGGEEEEKDVEGEEDSEEEEGEGEKSRDFSPKRRRRDEERRKKKEEAEEREEDRKVEEGRGKRGGATKGRGGVDAVSSAEKAKRGLGREREREGVEKGDKSAEGEKKRGVLKREEEKREAEEERRATRGRRGGEAAAHDLVGVSPAFSDPLSLVGKRIDVWWPLDKVFYSGVVSDYVASTKRHKILYDDGDTEMLNLSRQKWKFEEKEEKARDEKRKEQDKEEENQRDGKKKGASGSSSKEQRVVAPFEAGNNKATKRAHDMGREKTGGRERGEKDQVGEETAKRERMTDGEKAKEIKEKERSERDEEGKVFAGTEGRPGEERAEETVKEGEGITEGEKTEDEETERTREKKGEGKGEEAEEDRKGQRKCSVGIYAGEAERQERDGERMTANREKKTTQEEKEEKSENAERGKAKGENIEIMENDESGGERKGRGVAEGEEGGPKSSDEVEEKGDGREFDEEGEGERKGGQEREGRGDNSNPVSDGGKGEEERGEKERAREGGGAKMSEGVPHWEEREEGSELSAVQGRARESVGRSVEGRTEMTSDAERAGEDEVEEVGPEKEMVPESERRGIEEERGEREIGQEKESQFQPERHGFGDRGEKRIGRNEEKDGETKRGVKCSEGIVADQSEEKRDCERAEEKQGGGPRREEGGEQLGGELATGRPEERKALGEKEGEESKKKSVFEKCSTGVMAGKEGKEETREEKGRGRENEKGEEAEKIEREETEEKEERRSGEKENTFVPMEERREEEKEEGEGDEEREEDEEEEGEEQAQRKGGKGRNRGRKRRKGGGEDAEQEKGTGNVKSVRGGGSSSSKGKGGGKGGGGARDGRGVSTRSISGGGKKRK